MNIVIFGAGAIGSLFGALLSKKNNVTLIGRASHVDVIKKHGLNIKGKTQLNVKIPAEDSIKKIKSSPDLLILTVKSYDTENAMKEAKPVINDNTLVLSLQNGLDNVDKIEKMVDRKNIFVGITTHGAIFSSPGVINHTGKGQTILGYLSKQKTESTKQLVDMFNETGIETEVSTDIIKDIWTKAIINSSINPLTTFFQCKNGYLLENPILECIIEKICEESTIVANKEGINLSSKNMYNKTKQVILDTGENYSSMLQSFQRGKRTEIDSINGKIVEMGKQHGLNPLMNEILVYSVKAMCK